jgi:hypothetical protein
MRSLHPIVCHKPIVGGEVDDLFVPLGLDIFARGDVEDTPIGMMVSKEGHRPQGNVGFPHANFIGQISYLLAD